MPIILNDDGTSEFVYDEETTRKNRRLAEKKAGELPVDMWKQLRILAKTNLFFLANTVLNFDKLTVALHGHMCNWHDQTKGDQFREFLLPRGHYKSTVMNTAQGVQIVLPDDTGNEPWPRNLGTDCRLLICHEIKDQAERFLGGIQGHFLENIFLMALFPETIPDPRKHKVNKSELVLPRKKIWVEPTIDTLGVGGRAQGRHYNYLILDDLIGDKARDSKSEMEAAKLWFDNIQSLFSSFKVDHFDLIGTRWSHDDLYAHAHDVYGQDLKRYVRKVEEVNPVTKQKESIFPEEFPQNKLHILRKNSKVWNAQYLNDPFEGIGNFDPNWKRYYYFVSPVKIAFFDKITHEKEEIYLSEMNKYILIDPAMSGLAGFLVVGVDKRGRIFILEALKDEWKPPELVDLMFKKSMQWQARVVGIEAVLFSGLFEHWLVTEMSVRRYKFKVEALKTRGVEKEARVVGLSNFFKAGQIFFNEGQLDLIEEYDRFGFTDNIHMLDALAHGPQIWKPYTPSYTIASNTSKIDKQSGYSAIKYSSGR